MQSAMVCKSFLAESLLLAEAPHASTQCQQDLLHLSSLRFTIRASLQTDRLQTSCNLIKWDNVVPKTRLAEKASAQAGT